MKVCLLNDSFPPVLDGVANVVMNYAKIMQEDNLADVCVATPKYPNTEYHTYPYMVIPYESVDTTRIAMGYRAGNPLSIIELKDLTDFKPDILHAHSPASATYMARLLRFNVNVPLVYTYHTKYDIDISNAIHGKIAQKEAINAIVRNVSACDEVWVVSKGAGENLKSLGYTGDCRVMNNGVDFQKGKVAPEDVKNTTKGYDLPEGIPVFLFVGRIMNYKGLPLIMEALSMLSKDGIDFRMVFVGGGPDADELKKTAERHLKPGQCIFTGPIYDRDELRAWNTRADVFLFPSTFDTNGLVVREAAACGLASVLIKDSCASEGVSDGVDGFLIDENASSMYEMLKKISKDLSFVHKVGDNAMNNLYISWKDSVYEANDRYLQIIDDYKSGKLVLHHNAFSSSLLDIKEDMEEEQEKARIRIQTYLEEIKEDARKIKEEIKNIV